MNLSKRNTDSTNDGAQRNTLAATFDSRDAAHDAVRRLHDEGFHGAWIGLTHPNKDEAGGDPYTGATTATAADATMVEAENWFQRLFGEKDETLHDALVRHGVRESDLRAVGPVPPGSVILTIDGSNHPELAAQIISECGGDLITSGATDRGYASADTGMASATSAGAGSYRDCDYSEYGRYRGGETLDDTRVSQLRDERRATTPADVQEYTYTERGPIGDTGVATSRAPSVSGDVMTGGSTSRTRAGVTSGAGGDADRLIDSGL